MKKRDELDERLAQAYEQFKGGLTDIAKACGVARTTAYNRLKKMGLSRPLVEGTLLGMQEKEMKLPGKGKIKRYICTSAQNNTYVNDAVWENLLALTKHYNAKLLVGTFSYNQNRFSKLAVKRGKKKSHQSDLWYDDKLLPYFSDDRLSLAHGLVWCGEMNILPTANDPLEGLETYSQRRSGIFPHAKMSMKSIATMKGEGTKINFTTGTVTQMNYIQKKAGLKGEHHHVYGAVVVEVDHEGHWWVRQLDADKTGRIQDLDVVVDKGEVTTGNRVEAITWGDIHGTCLDGEVSQLSHKMMDDLKPKFQFIHDIFEGVSFNHHAAADCHEKYRAFLRGFDSVEAELKSTANVVWAYCRDSVKTVIVDSNHDAAWLARWLREHDYRRDPRNAMLFLELQLATFKALAANDQSFNLTEVALRRFTEQNCRIPADVKFLKTDESFKTCNDTIENGMHGHLGPNGARGTPANLNKVGRRANTGHTHSAEIINGLYVAGTSSKLDFGYNKGPSSWTHSHIVTYPNGKRTIITMYANKWRA